MIILRQKEFRKKSSIYWSQSGNDHLAPTIHIINGKDIIAENEDDFPRIANDFHKRLIGKRLQKYDDKKAVQLSKKGEFVFTQYQGKDKCNRLVPHNMVSDKSPSEAYRDYLRSINKRMERPDIIESDPLFSKKEIKEQLRKAATKRNIKKAAPWTIGGTLVAGGTIARVKAYKKHKKDKKK